MAARYKTTTLSGTPILSHRKVWILTYGEIPDGMHVHHINEDRFDNRIENLALISAEDHARHHATGRASWNKGMKCGSTEAYMKSNVARKINHAEQCERTFFEWLLGASAKDLAKKYGVVTRQIHTRLRSYVADSALPDGRWYGNATSSH